MRVVLDTNVLISGIFWAGTPFRILELWNNKKINLIVTEEILQKYVAVLRRHEDHSGIADEWLMLFSQRFQIIENQHHLRLSRDPYDDMFINGAITGRAKYIISGDKDLLTLHSVKNIRIVSPAQFLKIFTEETSKK
ncbi:MAG: putative toxin-antitoxin system toxin component, PIN family [Candidatus Kerfeldbacteria bacterium]|nr:putative toxin-antitoxin system toxin component, PIN family [Candidatus Kerfeldbacteria bacterium]